SSTDSGVKRSSSISKAVIFRAPSLGLLDGVLLASALELRPDDLLRVEIESVGEEQGIGEDVGELTGDFVPVRIGTPLEALQELCGLDRDRLREVLRRVELVPFALGGESAEGVHHGVAGHDLTLAMRGPRRSLVPVPVRARRSSPARLAGVELRRRSPAIRPTP